MKYTYQYKTLLLHLNAYKNKALIRTFQRFLLSLALRSIRVFSVVLVTEDI